MKGVLQVETASPSLFNLFIEGIVEDLQNSNIHGFKLHTIIIHILLYADDMVIVAASKETLQLKIDVAARFLRKRGLIINIEKSKIVVFKRSGRISKLDFFHWNGNKIEVVKSYKYLGVTFHSNGVFDSTAAEFVKKGIMAQGAIFASLKRTKLFNLGTHSKLFDSIVKSTTLHAAGIWGLQHGDKVERVQQQYFKRALNLPTCTPRHFIRLETGRAHTSTEIMKLALLMYDRVLRSPPNSLLFEAYSSLRRVSILYPIKKFSWCIQLKEALSELGYINVWDTECASLLSVHRKEILRSLRHHLGAVDLNHAHISKSIPHYFPISNGFEAEKYLSQNLPTYLVTCICQIRLNVSIVYNQRKWYNLAMFESKLCKFCGEEESFAHLFECPHFKDLKSRILPPYLPFNNFDDVLKLMYSNINNSHCKSLYFFITSALKTYNN